MMQPKLLAVATCKEGINESAHHSPTLPPLLHFLEQESFTNHACVIWQLLVVMMNLLK
jgi:hypothetical protein